MRSLADQTVDELGGRRSILHRQKQDHEKLNRMLEELPSASDEGRDALLQRISRLVFTHAFAEEAVLWPALRRALEDGDELTVRVEREHQEITELVAAIDQSPTDDAERQALVDRTITMLRQDVRDEEDVLLPRLQEAVDVKTLRRLGMTWEIVRQIAPTRTHPIASRRPPGQTLSALPLSVTDRLRDVLDSLARRVSPPAASAFSDVSNRLESIGRRIESVPLLRRGERPETSVDGRIR